MLKINIVSLGDVEEMGYDISLKNWRLSAFDHGHVMLISLPRTANHIYIVKFGVVPLVCILSKMDDEAWR